MGQCLRSSVRRGRERPAAGLLVFPGGAHAPSRSPLHATMLPSPLPAPARRLQPDVCCAPCREAWGCFSKAALVGWGRIRTQHWFRYALMTMKSLSSDARLSFSYALSLTGPPDESRPFSQHASTPTQAPTSLWGGEARLGSSLVSRTRRNRQCGPARSYRKQEDVGRCSLGEAHALLDF